MSTIVLSGLRSVILSDPYMATLLQPNQVHTGHISELGPTQKMPAITLQISGPGGGVNTMYTEKHHLIIDLWSQLNYKELANIYENRSSATKIAYGSIKGLKPLLHYQRFFLPDLGYTIFLYQQDCSQVFDRYINAYNIKASWMLSVIDKEVENVPSWVQD